MPFAPTARSSIRAPASRSSRPALGRLTRVGPVLLDRACELTPIRLSQSQRAEPRDQRQRRDVHGHEPRVAGDAVQRRGDERRERAAEDRAQRQAQRRAAVADRRRERAPRTPPAADRDTRPAGTSSRDSDSAMSGIDPVSASGKKISDHRTSAPSPHCMMRRRPIRSDQMREQHDARRADQRRESRSAAASSAAAARGGASRSVTKYTSRMYPSPLMPT